MEDEIWPRDDGGPSFGCACRVHSLVAQSIPATRARPRCREGDNTRLGKEKKSGLVFDGKFVV